MPVSTSPQSCTELHDRDIIVYYGEVCPLCASLDKVKKIQETKEDLQDTLEVVTHYADQYLESENLNEMYRELER